MDNYNKVIIVGAGRSGTNMLRDVLVSIPGFGTWDCDEINPIWRHGNIKHETDELQPENATTSVKEFIRNEFKELGRKNKLTTIVEKTCANSLRVPFVYEIFPEAKYIFIYRDGRDVVASAMKRWTSRLDFKYSMKKLRYVPKSDLLHYIFKYGLNRVRRSISGQRELPFWGPIYEGMKEDTRSLPLVSICAKQWQKCVDSSDRGFQLIPESQKLYISYEKFVNDPANEIEKIISYCGGAIQKDKINQLAKRVSSKSVGSYRKELAASQLSDIDGLIKPTLEKFGYI